MLYLLNTLDKLMTQLHGINFCYFTVSFWVYSLLCCWVISLVHALLSWIILHWYLKLRPRILSEPFQFEHWGYISYNLVKLWWMARTKSILDHLRKAFEKSWVWMTCSLKQRGHMNVYVVHNGMCRMDVMQDGNGEEGRGETN